MLRQLNVSKRRALVVVAVAAILAVLAWISIGRQMSGVGRQASGVGSDRDDSDPTLDTRRATPDARRPAPSISHAGAPGTVTLAGHVIDEVDRSPAVGAEVVLRGALGESSTVTRADGAFAIEVAPGAYHVGVRGGGVVSVGVADRERLDAGPSAALIAMPDDTLMPLVTANEDITNLELVLPRDATIAGTVSDRDGHRIAHAIVRARGATRPAFGSDVAETDGAGNYTLVVAAGRYKLEAGAPGFAGSVGPVDTTAIAHATSRVALVVVKGCEIRGRVVGADGKHAGDGAIERRSEDHDMAFGPAGHVEPDGTFRWTTLDASNVTLRAWPWKSAPTEERTFTCRDGARFSDVVLHVASSMPAVHGTIVDESGAPVPFAYIDVEALDPRLPSQQERADGEGRWELHDMPFGNYQLTASAPARGIAVTTIASPHAEAVELRLGGTGRIEGTTTSLGNGTIEVVFDACFDALDSSHRPMPIAHDPRLVAVQGGRFVIDEVPACDLRLAARWGEQRVQARVAVTASQIARIELAIGLPREKVVHGIVRDRDANPIANAHVTAVYEGRRAAATSDDSGHFTVRSFSGAQLVASDGMRVGSTTIGRANVADEQVELVIAPR